MEITAWSKRENGEQGHRLVSYLSEVLAKHMTHVAFISYTRIKVQNPVDFNNIKKVEICANSRTPESEYPSMGYFIT